MNIKLGTLIAVIALIATIAGAAFTYLVTVKVSENRIKHLEERSLKHENAIDSLRKQRYEFDKLTAERLSRIEQYLESLNDKIDMRLDLTKIMQVAKNEIKKKQPGGKI